MNLAEWLSLAGVCLLGAMSPGPSLAVVISQTLRGGAGAGAAAAIAHGIGVALYAAVVVSGLAVLIAETPALFAAAQYAGALFLLYLGIRSLLSRGTAPDMPAAPVMPAASADGKIRHSGEPGNDGAGNGFARMGEGASSTDGYRGADGGLRGACIAGFTVAFLNPKLAVFFLALFSQFLSPEAGLAWKALMVATVGLIDAGWYALVSLLLGQSGMLERLRRRQRAIDRLFGLILIALAMRIAIQ